MSSHAWFWATLAAYATLGAVASMSERRRHWRYLAARNITCGRIELRVYDRVGYWQVWRSMRAAVDLTIDGRWSSTHFGGMTRIETVVHVAAIIGARTGVAS